MDQLFTGILSWLNSIFGNYGWSIVAFTFLVRLVLLPLDYKSRVGMRRMQKVAPMQAELQRKYGKDQEKLNRKMAELYKREKVNPMASCLPLLLSYPILIMMFNAMRSVANQNVTAQVLEILQNPEVLPHMESFYWIKNVWMPDSFFASVLPDQNMLMQVTKEAWQQSFTLRADEWAAVLANYPALAELTAASFEGSGLRDTAQLIYSTLQTTPIYSSSTAIMPGWTFNLLIVNFSIMKDFNGWFLLPAFSACSQILMTKLNPAQQQPAANGANNQQQNQQNGTMSFMNWFFPLFTLWICSTSNGMFALYWVASNIVMVAETWGINKYLDLKEKKAQPIEGEGAIK